MNFLSALSAISTPSGSTLLSVDPPSTSRRSSRLQDSIWDEVLVEDGIVSGSKCAKKIHTSGKTHVERVRYHFTKKCVKRLYTPLITLVFRPAMKLARVREFQKLFAMWLYLTGMAFNEASHHSLVTTLRPLTSSDIVRTRQQLTGSLLDACYEEFSSKMMLKIANRRCTVVTDS
ncbi:hypothetical protein PPTG_09453 [Phytophthora nicotianae INRA-310]|uniref:Uncharacterized protein n=1 Tax=Phytophthora nicotianae (strain INRA-310) TaxID=761204 RepID=W2QHJ4_PHYN3|nr:hypothetical protein PPTG_09453 [Phytophthora nicotianae INRA-310]ETN11745.1 hypothetical protein PPTG_09453 [Phytophthora nicotianae INRA-310]